MVLNDYKLLFAVLQALLTESGHLEPRYISSQLLELAVFLVFWFKLFCSVIHCIYDYFCNYVMTVVFLSVLV